MLDPNKIMEHFHAQDHEITRLREKLRIAEETLCEYESREIDSGNLRGGIAAVALKDIRDVK